MDYREFLQKLFGTKRAEDFVNIWQLPTKQSNFFQDIDGCYASCLILHLDFSI
jgi:hypothetical protein